MSFSNSKSGFTLIEVIIYVGIFAASAVFLVAILGAVTRIQTRQLSTNEVNQQISFITRKVQQLVQESSLIENEAGVSDSTIILRMGSSSIDKTFIYASGTQLYIEQGTTLKGTGKPVALSNSNINVDAFNAIKYENPGGGAIMQINLALSYKTTNPQAQFSRAIETAITRISAANFDSSLIPNGSTFDLGTQSTRWRDGYFSGIVKISGNTSIGTTFSTLRLNVGGDIGFAASGQGLILRAINGNCYRLTVTNNGGLATSTAACSQ